MDTTSTAPAAALPAAALPATALPVGAAMWQDIAGANMEADFESDLAHALALSQEEAPVETAATEADAGIRPLRKKLKAADVDAFDVDTECPICFETFFPRAQVTACPQCFSGVTHAGYCTTTLKDAPMLLTRATGDTDDERFFKLCCLSLPPSLSLSLSLSLPLTHIHRMVCAGLCRCDFDTRDHAHAYSDLLYVSLSLSLSLSLVHALGR